MPAIGKAYRFSNSRRDLPALFRRTAIDLGIQHKLIRPYTPRHNGKVERNRVNSSMALYWTMRSSRSVIQRRGTTLTSIWTR